MSTAIDSFVKNFKNKNVMIFVPHQDDEIGFSGSLIYSLAKARINTYVVFMTNGDYESNGERRIKEAISALKVLGVPKKHVIFLGYGDCLNGGNNHILYSDEETPIISNAGRKETYSIKGHAEWYFKKFGLHHAYTRTNLFDDISSILLDIKPDSIFGIDCDYHSDHRALSIILEEAIGEIMKLNCSYRPQVFKGFSYSTGYKAKADYSYINLNSTLKPEKECCFELSNPIYSWEERLRIPVDKNCRTETRYRNVIYKALKKHRSQYASRYFSQIANSDEIFWKRRTDSLTYESGVEVSSGNGALLIDFKYLDSDDILKPKGEMLNFSKGVWIPNEGDSSKQATFFLKDKYTVNQISIYENPEPSENITLCQLIFSNGFTILVDYIRHDGKETKVLFSPQNDIEWVKFKIIESVGVNAGLSELEIYPPKSFKIWFLKICIDDNFVYDYYTTRRNVKFSVRAYNENGESIEISPEQLIMEVITPYRVSKIDKYSFILNRAQIFLKVSFKDSIDIQDEIRILRLSNSKKSMIKINKKLDSFILDLDDYFVRFVNKVWKIRNKFRNTSASREIQL